MRSNVHMRPTWSKIPYEQQRLRQLRQSVPASLSALADAASVSYGHLRRVETTCQQPSPELATRLAQALTKMSGRTVVPADFVGPVAVEDAA